MSNAPSVGTGQLVTLYDDGNIVVSAEESSGMVFLHCTVEEYSKSVHLYLKDLFKEVKEVFYLNGHDEVFAYATEKPAKFVKKLGDYEVVTTFEHLDKEYEVLRWDLR